MLTRREILKTIGTSGVVLGTPLSRLFRASSSADAAGASADPAAGELYAGFLLLPDGAPVPSTVQPSRFGTPIVCGLGGKPATARSMHYGTHTEVAKNAAVPLYSPSHLPPTLRPAGGDIIEYEWGGVFTASLDFETYQSDSNTWGGGEVSLWAETEFPRPYPFWMTSIAGVPPKKVGFLPAPGLQVASGMGSSGRRLGYTFYWIDNGFLHWLRVENYSSEDEAQALATTLTRLR